MALGLALVVASAAPAAAHASLISVDPADGARLDESPATVTLTFSEPVSTDLGGVRVLDGDGERVDAGAARTDGSVVRVDLQPNLAEGTYVISYRVVSADGHPVRGGSVFGVGDVAVDAGALGRVAGSDDRVWEVVGGVGRLLAYAGVLVAAGGGLFLVVAHRHGAERATLVRFVRRAALVGAVGVLVALPVQAALGTGQGPLSLFDDGVLADVADDGVGLSLLLALLGLALVVVGLERWAPVAAAGALLAAGSFAATGHTRAGDTAAVATVTDVAHLEAAAAWGGGLVVLWLTLRLRRRAGTEGDAVETGEVVVRFSQMATVAIVVVGVTGAVLGWNEVRALSALTSTGYGLFLIAKVAAVGAVACLGAYNHFRLVPAIQAGKARSGLARLQQTLRLEALALVLVAALTSVLVVMTPAKASVQGGVVEEIVELDEAGSVQLVVSPATAGFNQIHLYTYDPTGRPADIAESVSLELSLPAAGLGPIDREPERAGPAHLQLDGRDLAVAGRWTITVRARVDRFTEATGTVEIDIAG
ncbi:MAG: copper resistance protein CopC [Acidimicrobiales bacterium]